MEREDADSRTRMHVVALAKVCLKEVRYVRARLEVGGRGRNPALAGFTLD